MPIVTRFSHLSNIEFERELEHRARSGQLVLGEETTRELMERVRVWVMKSEENEHLRDEVEELQEEVLSLEADIAELKGELKHAYS